MAVAQFREHNFYPHSFFLFHFTYRTKKKMKNFIIPYEACGKLKWTHNFITELCKFSFRTCFFKCLVLLTHAWSMINFSSFFLKLVMRIFFVNKISILFSNKFEFNQLITFKCSFKIAYMNVKFLIKNNNNYKMQTSTQNQGSVNTDEVNNVVMQSTQKFN